MDGDFGAMLESVLSDPGKMEQVAHIAQGLMNGSDAAAPENPKSDAATASPTPMDAGLFSMIGKMLGGREEKSRSTALLMAMRPYMRQEKQEKLDRAMNIARMVHVAGAVMQQYGGGFRGI